MIRKFEQKDASRVMQIWLEGNTQAHSFIPEEYWVSNYQLVQEQILQADVYVYEADGEIQGFAGLTDGYLAGIFVEKRYRSLGIGKQLLDYIKGIYSTLELNVYQKNKRATEFYFREGFSVIAEGLDKETGERDYTMLWGKH